jgi:hypothetical protein
MRRASGGAIYIRDPFGQIDDEQLNGGEVVPQSEKNWDLILLFLQEKERLFGISVTENLLTIKGEERGSSGVYRKVRPQQGDEIAADGLEEWGAE